MNSLKVVLHSLVGGRNNSNKSYQQYFHMVLFIKHVALRFEPVYEILWCDPVTETSSTILSHSTIY